MPFRQYSQDIKLSAVKLLLEGVPKAAINDRLGVEIAGRSLTRWSELYRRTHSVIADPATYEKRGCPLKVSDEERAFLLDILTKEPTLHINELQKKLMHKGIKVSGATVRREVKERLGHLKMAQTVHPAPNPAAPENHAIDVAKMPRSFLVFTGGTAISMQRPSRPRALAKNKQRTHRVMKICAIRKFTLLPAIAEEGVIAAMCQEGGNIRLDYESFLKNHLFPMMNPYPGPRSVLIATNRKIHRGKRILEMCKDKGIRCIFLPEYSPDLNPLKKAVQTLELFFRRSTRLLDHHWNMRLIRHHCLRILNEELMPTSFDACGY